MGIQLIGISHKTAPLQIRGLFAFSKEESGRLLQELAGLADIDECVLLATCNRTEVYVWSACRQGRHRIYAQVQDLLLTHAHVTDMADSGHIFRFYEDDRAIQHLFMVACGLDSLVMGEDQILGQVKDAQQLAAQQGTCGPYLHTLFRYAVTAAKKAKTQTKLSTTPVSTAGISIRAAREILGSLDEARILLIGAGGKIGRVICQNLLADTKAQLYVTVREGSVLPAAVREEKARLTVIAYERRYDYLADMDVIISATASPHYTLTYDSVCASLCGRGSVHQEAKEEVRTRVFLDLAVPIDIESRIGTLPGVRCLNMDDFKRTAEENNVRRHAEAACAQAILEDDEAEYRKWMIFQMHRADMRRTKELILADADQRGLSQAIDRFFYHVRKTAGPDTLQAFMDCLQPQQWENEKKNR